MISPRPLSRQAQAPRQPILFCLLLVSSVLAQTALQNVTVDDAVLTGAVVPQYLPSKSDWNVVVDNNCTACFVKPDPTLAYDGTWHDATYSPTNSYSQAIEFTFTGSALYIFFIIANNVTDATTLTDVQFVLDGVLSGNAYVHTPGTTTDYQYNVPVYANESLGSGQHNMVIQPVNSGNAVLILFDYLIYTTDTSSSVTTSTSPTSTSPTSTSPTSTSPTSGTQGTSSGQNIGAIVGGTVGGVAALVFVIASLFCYRRYRRCNDNWASAGEGVMPVEPFFDSVEMAPTSLISATSPVGSPYAGSMPKTTSSIVRLPSSTPPSTTTAATSIGAPSSTNAGLVEQVGLLRDEVARLRDLHEVPPPEYSMDQNRWID